jgi:transposase
MVSLVPIGPTQKGGVNAAVLIAFVMRPIGGARHEIISIADPAPARIAKKTRTLGDSQKRKSQLFYLPPYPPDRNPDQLARKQLEADTAGHMAVTSGADFQNKVWASLRQLQDDPK